MLFMFFFFFKQKTAYEMRISDWSSDVYSSDLEPGARGHARKPKAWLAPRRLPVKAWPDAFAGRALRGNLSARMQIAEPAIGCPTHAASAPASSCALDRKSTRLNSSH